MSSLTNPHLRKPWLESIGTVLIWAMSLPLHAQSPAAPSPTPLPTQQFGEIGEALTLKADTLLVNVDEPSLLLVKATPAAAQHALSLKLASPSAAVARVELLRSTIDPILRGEGVPVEFAAVVLIESGGNTNALSPKGARGLWQLMPDTARRYGLAVDGSRDERVDIEKSTRAASRYLSDLHQQFGSWPLALAAYNTGEQNLQRAITRGRSVDFNILSSSGFLPFETRSYVPAVLAATQSFGQPSALGTQNSKPSAITMFATSSR
jgi:hypothetical protein